MTRIIIIGIFMITGFALVGCTEKRPDGMPDLHPISVTLTQDGQPLAEASVLLLSDDESLTRWGVGGSTDQNGVATIRTYGKYPGAPAGEYRVIVMKTETETDPATQNKNWTPKFPGDGEKVYHLVDQQYSNPNSSPLKVTIEKGGNKTVSFEIGKPIRQEYVRNKR